MKWAEMNWWEKVSVCIGGIIGIPLFVALGIVCIPMYFITKFVHFME